jgi:hypothetical protein
VESPDAMVLLTRAGIVDGRLRMDDEALAAKARYWAEVLGDMTLAGQLLLLPTRPRLPCPLEGVVGCRLDDDQGCGGLRGGS